MCGVIGITSEQEVAEKIWLGLIGIQHRGQDAAGIITYKNGRFYLKKGKGTVQSLFNEQDIQRLQGRVGIGHVRYPTIGAGDPEDAQPFYTNSPFGIAMAHNGNVINYNELKDWLINYVHRHINTKNDVEVILNIFAAFLNPLGTTEAIFTAVEKVMEKVKGSYSCVAFIADKGLLGFRDPCGIKPLKFGIKNNEFCFASESVALDILDYKEMEDVVPGEAIFIDTNKKVHRSKIMEANPRHCIFEYIYFARPDSTIDNISVYEARYKLGEELAKQIKKLKIKPDVVIPVPDTAKPVALSLSIALGIPYREGLIKNRYIGRTFIMPRDVNRAELVRYKLNTIKNEIKNKKVLIVDDSIVRGTTSRAIVSLIREAKPKKVYFVSSCPPLRYPCYYGIDMQTKQEFIAKNKPVEEIKKELGVDELIYQSMDGMLNAVATPLIGRTPSVANEIKQSHFCTACFSGDYPTDISEADQIEKERTLYDKK